MKFIVILGKAGSGKSTTINEICRRLDPEKVWRLEFDKNDYDASLLITANVDEIFNHTFIIEVNGKMILVVSGAPTEQNITITVLIDICVKIGVKIDFAIVEKRVRENEGFSTISELKTFGEIVREESVLNQGSDQNIDSLRQIPEWNEWIEGVKDSVLLFSRPGIV